MAHSHAKYRLQRSIGWKESELETNRQTYRCTLLAVSQDRPVTDAHWMLFKLLKKSPSIASTDAAFADDESLLELGMC